MLKFTASSGSKKKDKKANRSSRLVQGSSQESPSWTDGQDESATEDSNNLPCQEESDVLDNSTSETGTVKRRPSSKSNNKKPSVQRHSNASAAVPCKAFVGGGMYSSKVCWSSLFNRKSFYSKSMITIMAVLIF